MAVLPIYGEQVLNLEQPAAALDITDTSKTSLVLRQFPLGEYFNRAAGWLPKTARAWARTISRWVERKSTMERNMDPRTADELLPEWEQMLDIEPDPASTLADRRDAIHTKFVALGGVTAEYYEGVATDFGYGDAVVTDAADPFTTVSLADDFLAGGEWKVTFLLTAASQTAARDAQLVDLINGQLLAGWFALYDFT